jgi:hypothetical protein
MELAQYRKPVEDSDIDGGGLSNYQRFFFLPIHAGTHTDK